MVVVSAETVRVTPGFAVAAAGLRRLRRPDYSQARTALIQLEPVLRAARILQELDPDKLLFRDGTNWVRDDSARQRLLEDVTEAIQPIAPLMIETVEMDLEDGYVRLVPAEMGFAMNWDEWYEMTADPAEYLSQSSAPWAFCEALLQGDEAAFESFSNFYEWDLSYPKRGGGEIDWKKMVRLLDRRGLGCFEAAWNIASYSTGNIYFDYNIYEDNLPLPPFSIEGVRELRRQYQAAQPILEQYRECVRLFAEPDVPAAVLRIYVRSLVKEKEKPKTLVDVFREERERGYLGPDEENDTTDPLGVLERVEGELQETRAQIDELYQELGLYEEEQGNDDDEYPIGGW